MKQMNTYSRISIFILTILGAALLLSLTGISPAYSQVGQKTFASPDEAAKAFVEACGANDEKALIEILGPQGKSIIITSDRAGDADARKKFFSASREKLNIEKTGVKKMTIVIGKNSWPFPIPIVKDGEGWRFDTAAGREEIFNRRIGRNELNAIAVCRAYVDAQRQYAAKDRSGAGILEYARKFGSSPGKKDGLYWPADNSQEMSPFGPLIVPSSDYQAARKQGEPYHGYYFRILDRQGSSVPGGAFNYVINGHMLAGFALVAFPADYGTSGVVTFVINQWGFLYQKDLGDDTAKLAGAMNTYNPDSSWSIVKEKGALASE
jgi:hypothetical protein